MKIVINVAYPKAHGIKRFVCDTAKIKGLNETSDGEVVVSIEMASGQIKNFEVLDSFIEIFKYMN